MTPFRVATDSLAISVTTDGSAVTGIELADSADRGAETAFERQVERELREYFSGDRHSFTFATAPVGTAFQQRVWRELLRIPYGGTATYGEVADRVGNRKASRAVGGANNRNPIPIVIPCHRVVAAGGKLGGYGGGVALKRSLLDLEASHRPEASHRRWQS